MLPIEPFGFGGDVDILWMSVSRSQLSLVASFDVALPFEQCTSDFSLDGEIRSFPPGSSTEPPNLDGTTLCWESPTSALLAAKIDAAVGRGQIGQIYSATSGILVFRMCGMHASNAWRAGLSRCGATRDRELQGTSTASGKTSAMAFVRRCIMLYSRWRRFLNRRSEANKQFRYTPWSM